MTNLIKSIHAEQFLSRLGASVLSLALVSSSVSAGSLTLSQVKPFIGPTGGFGSQIRLGEQPGKGLMLGGLHLNTADNASGDGSVMSTGSVSVGDNIANVETIDTGDVAGTVCDCGEIAGGGGFPKWPLLALAGIPLIFLAGRDGSSGGGTSIVTPPPGPGNPNAPVPEPLTLLLFGTGLAGAALAGRRRKQKAA